MPKNKLSDLIARAKWLNIAGSSTNINSGIGGNYSALVNYQLLLSNIFPLPPPPPIIFPYKIYRRNRLLRVSFIKP